MITMTNPTETTKITALHHGGFLVTVNGYSVLATTRMLATILAETLTNDQPEGVDFRAWAGHYVTEIWPDEIDRLHGTPDDDTRCVSDVEPVHYVYAALGLGLLTIPDGWDSGAWHPTGLHLWGPQGEIVITGWNDADNYDVGAYAADDVDHDGDSIDPVPCDDLIDHLRDLFTMLPAVCPLPAPRSVAERIAPPSPGL